MTLSTEQEDEESWDSPEEEVEVTEVAFPTMLPTLPGRETVPLAGAGEDELPLD